MTKHYDNIWPGLGTGPDEFAQRDDAEQQDAATLRRELQEQGRIAPETGGAFDHNRVPTPGTGDGAGGRVRLNRDHWGE